MKQARYSKISGDFCRLLITFANSLEPDQHSSMSVLI